MLNEYDRHLTKLLIRTQFRPVLRGVSLNIGELCDRLLQELDAAHAESISLKRELDRERIRL